MKINVTRIREKPLIISTAVSLLTSDPVLTDLYLVDWAPVRAEYAPCIQHVTSLNRREFHYGHSFRYPLPPIRECAIPSDKHSIYVTNYRSFEIGMLNREDVSIN